jgi:hypothetical protein
MGASSASPTAVGRGVSTCTLDNGKRFRIDLRLTENGLAAPGTMGASNG